ELRIAFHRDIERSRCVLNRPAKFSRRVSAPLPSQLRRPSPEFLCSPPRDLFRLQSHQAPGANRRSQRSRSTPCRRHRAARSHANLFRPKKSSVCIRDVFARSTSCFHRQGTRLSRVSCSQPRPASPHSSSRPRRQPPSAPECRAQLSTRSRRSSRSRLTPRRVYVSFFDRMNRINKISQNETSPSCFGRRNFFLNSSRSAPKFKTKPSSRPVATRYFTTWTSWILGIAELTFS